MSGGLKTGQTIQITFLRRSIASVEGAVQSTRLLKDGDDVIYGIYSAACGKEFELVLSQSGKASGIT